MSLQDRLSTLITSIGADISQLFSRVSSLESTNVSVNTTVFDPWTYVVLDVDATSSVLPPTETALRFTPVPNTLYEVQGVLYLRSPDTTVGVRPGIKWPLPTANILQNVAWVMAGQTAAAFVSRIWGTTNTQTPNTTGSPVANEGHYGAVSASFRTGPDPVTGDFVITIETEVDGVEVVLAMNSWIKYRVITSDDSGQVIIDGGAP